MARGLSTLRLLTGTQSATVTVSGLSHRQPANGKVLPPPRALRVWVRILAARNRVRFLEGSRCRLAPRSPACCVLLHHPYPEDFSDSLAWGTSPKPACPPIHLTDVGLLDVSPSRDLGTLFLFTSPVSGWSQVSA